MAVGDSHAAPPQHTFINPGLEESALAPTYASGALPFCVFQGFELAGNNNASYKNCLKSGRSINIETLGTELTMGATKESFSIFESHNHYLPKGPF